MSEIVYRNHKYREFHESTINNDTSEMWVRSADWGVLDTMCVVLRSINCDTDARLTTGVEHNVLSVVGAPLPPYPNTHTLIKVLFVLYIILCVILLYYLPEVSS